MTQIALYRTQNLGFLPGSFVSHAGRPAPHFFPYIKHALQIRVDV
ncbi:hypothetical protein RBWH47_02330 [Rhodopirellula baltica WH47]|uniref:Uncharacterized protein n=1 Tax=Rhodopirellula baltica WH47 TaxID=991778 RepID=F2AKN0_RHOBT|nr:hypothetical protein RBWH47_02330 [Rhodopirellula baltica WH47]